MASIAWLMVWIIVGVHLLWASIIIGGSLAAISGYLFRNPRAERMYLLTVGLTLVSFVVSPSCILTNLELQLRTLAGLPLYSQGFIGHMFQIFFDTTLNPSLVSSVTIPLTAFGLLSVASWHIVHLLAEQRQKASQCAAIS